MWLPCSVWHFYKAREVSVFAHHTGWFASHTSWFFYQPHATGWVTSHTPSHKIELPVVFHHTVMAFLSRSIAQDGFPACTPHCMGFQSNNISASLSWDIQLGCRRYGQALCSTLNKELWRSHVDISRWSSPLPSPVKQWSPSSFIHLGMLRDSNKLLCHTLPSISSHCCHCHLCDDAGYCVDTHYQVDVAITVSSDWHWWYGHFSMFNLMGCDLCGWLAPCWTLL